MTNQELNDLLARFEGSSLSKLKLSTQEFTIEMERAVSAPAAPAIPAAAAAPAAPVSAEPEGDAITAPMVGTFYTAPTPDQPPFVQVGDRVKKGDPLCLLEAMKMMSEVTAPCDCEITAVLKENGALVSFGDGLFGYRPC
ncbi:biotin/lipoyl-containing protein [uncultured Dysosmobacter sp.]|uniref:acetyl-CoA carboxylase biotin carboxyl carrier protein n=1 Tax=uncultured Dysosmobacter sp. TaxID=2591384 RepID=UPI0026710DFE|nr:biotin/lipoyl-containing protein [uncultured Dysosmobacter sp.]